MDDLNNFMEVNMNSSWGPMLVDLGIGTPSWGDQMMLEGRCQVVIRMDDPFSPDSLGGLGGLD